MTNRIKELRQKNGMSQKHLSNILNVCQGTISGWENGRYDVDQGCLRKMADIFETSIDYILGGDIDANDDFKINKQKTSFSFNIGERIKELRCNANMTQKELADIVGCSTSTIGMYEQNRREPDFECLICIAIHFGVSVDFLFGIDNNEKCGFSQRLKDQRQKSGYSQKAIASKLLISQQAYAKYESGTASPNPETLKRIADILGISVDFLLSSDASDTTPCDVITLFSSKIKELRVSRGKKQSDIADYLNVDRTTYGKYETGASEPNFYILSKIADYYNVSYDYLLGKSPYCSENKSCIDPQIEKIEKTLSEIGYSQITEEVIDFIQFLILKYNLNDKL